MLPAVALVLMVGSRPVFAQPQPTRLGTSTDTDEPFKNSGREINQYFSGSKEATGPKDPQASAAATKAARWFVYRLTWQTPNRDFVPGIIKVFQRDYMGDALRDKEKNKVFMQIFNEQMVINLKELMALDFNANKIAQINAGVMMPTLAKYGDENFANYLTEMLKDPKLHDAIKLYALKGLREFFAVKRPDVDIDSVRGAELRKADAARVEVVLAFLTRETPKDAPMEELEATRFIRREAIKALAQTRIPATLVDKKGVKVPVAQGLLRVLVPEKNDLMPTSSLSEKAEAALGLCRIDPAAIEQYQPEASVYLVGKFLVDFARKYREDQSSFTASRPPLLPWKAYAKRLELALNAMQQTKAAKDAPYGEKLKVVIKNSNKMLTDMQRHATVEDAAVSALESALEKMWPTTPALPLFRGVPDVQIQLPVLKESP